MFFASENSLPARTFPKKKPRAARTGTRDCGESGLLRPEGVDPLRRIPDQFRKRFLLIVTGDPNDEFHSESSAVEFSDGARQNQTGTAAQPEIMTAQTPE